MAPSTLAKELKRARLIKPRPVVRQNVTSGSDRVLIMAAGGELSYLPLCFGSPIKLLTNFSKHLEQINSNVLTF